MNKGENTEYYNRGKELKKLQTELWERLAKAYRTNKKSKIISLN